MRKVLFTAIALPDANIINTKFEMLQDGESFMVCIEVGVTRENRQHNNKKIEVK